MRFNIAVVVVSALLCCSTALDFEDCGSVQGSLTDLKLSNCDPATMDYCPLKKGKNVTIDLTFLIKEIASKVDIAVHGYIAGVPLPFILPNPDGCVNSGLTCPLAANSTSTYTLTLPIRSIYPRVKVNIKLELSDQDGKEIICVYVPAKIV